VSPEAPDYILYATYATFWHDDQTLLFGTTYLPDKAGNITKTIALRVANGSSTTLNSNMTSGWRLNPHTKELAVLTYNLANTPYDEIKNAAVQVGTYTGKKWLGRISAPSGCNLAWSPEGTYLAYTAWGRTPDSCAVNLRYDPEFLFVNRADGQIGRFIPHLNRDKDEEALLIGWIATPTPR
jgi:hypothetical protein